MPERIIAEFTASSEEILKDELLGIYLHGSAAMGCFNPAKSDIDLIVVVKGPMTDDAKRAFMDMTVRLSASGPRKGIEMSVVRQRACKPFVYPTPYELHFSVGHLTRYMADPDAYIREMQGTDWDLAAHFTVIRTRGRRLFGLPIEEAFGEVPQRDYLDSIRRDVADAKKEIRENTMYLVLNLARVLAYEEEGKVLSKKEGGEWALDHLPARFRALVQNALDEYTKGAAVEYDLECAEEYADHMLKLFESEKDNREQRRRKREERGKKDP